MDNERVDIAPSFSFKPIDDGDFSVLSVSSSHHHDETSNFLMGTGPSADIFRAGRDSTPAVEKQRLPNNDEAMDDSSACRVVISPYPFSHASREEITEREQLSNTLSWTLASSNIARELKTKTANTTSLQADCSIFFGQAGAATDDVVMGDCDDFSVSIEDTESLSRDLGLEDPASFWEEGASTIPRSIYVIRTNSPTEISLGSRNDESKSLAASPSTSSS